jgi:hypothetical protein
MKNLLFLLFLFFSLSFTAQGNLQFNQVVYLSANTDNTTQWTVPAGKLWKIEAVGVYGSTLTVYFNGVMSFIYAGSYSNSSPSGYYRNADASPIWLPSGSILGQSCGCGGNRWFSILEFNVVP